MFNARLSFHGRRMGDIRSAQQKSVRRALLEPLILLHLEHLLSTPDFSLAAMSRLQKIAAEDIGLASPSLAPRLLGLSEDWKNLPFVSKARRLIQAAHLCTQTTASRAIAHLAYLIAGELPIEPPWRSLRQLEQDFEELLQDAIANPSLATYKAVALAAEEAFLRHPIAKELPLPENAALPASAMSGLWKRLLTHGSEHTSSYHQLFGKSPSQEGSGSRLFLYLAIADLVFPQPPTLLHITTSEDAEVEAWLERAKVEAYALQDFMFDKHTSSGRHANRGVTHFFEEGAILANPWLHSPFPEEELRQEALAKSLATEKSYRQKHRTAHIRARWRAAVANAGA